jgi:hypothetical protein
METSVTCSILLVPIADDDDSFLPVRASHSLRPEREDRLPSNCEIRAAGSQLDAIAQVAIIPILDAPAKSNERRVCQRSAAGAPGAGLLQAADPGQLARPEQCLSKRESIPGRRASRVSRNRVDVPVSFRRDRVFSSARVYANPGRSSGSSFRTTRDLMGHSLVAVKF